MLSLFYARLDLTDEAQREIVMRRLIAFYQAGGQVTPEGFSLLKDSERQMCIEARMRAKLVEAPVIRKFANDALKADEEDVLARDPMAANPTTPTLIETAQSRFHREQAGPPHPSQTVITEPITTETE